MKRIKHTHTHTLLHIHTHTLLHTHNHLHKCSKKALNLTLCVFTRIQQQTHFLTLRSHTKNFHLCMYRSRSETKILTYTYVLTHTHLHVRAVIHTHAQKTYTLTNTQHHTHIYTRIQKHKHIQTSACHICSNELYYLLDHMLKHSSIFYATLRSRALNIRVYALMTKADIFYCRHAI